MLGAGGLQGLSPAVSGEQDFEPLHDTGRLLGVAVDRECITKGLDQGIGPRSPAGIPLGEPLFALVLDASRELEQHRRHVIENLPTGVANDGQQQGQASARHVLAQLRRVQPSSLICPL